MTVSAKRKEEINIRNKRMASAYKKGETTTSIAKREGVSTATVSLALKENGARLPEIERVQRWIASGKTAEARRKSAASNERDVGLRFFEKIENTENQEQCWVWVGALSGSGRPQIYWKGRLVQASWVALFLDGRPREGGFYALHSCDNPMCVNPRHLWWGSQKENIRDAKFKGRLNLTGLSLGLPARISKGVANFR